MLQKKVQTPMYSLPCLWWVMFYIAVVQHQNQEIDFGSLLLVRLVDYRPYSVFTIF